MDLEFEQRRSKGFIGGDIEMSQGLMRSNEDIRDDSFKHLPKRSTTLEEEKNNAKDTESPDNDADGFDERFGHMMQMSDGSSQGIKFKPRIIFNRGQDNDRKFSKHSMSNRSYSEFLAQQHRRQSDGSAMSISSDSYGQVAHFPQNQYYVSNQTANLLFGSAGEMPK